MATFKICVFRHQQRKDGKYRVSIRISHNRQSAYLKTDTYVHEKQISSDFAQIKDTSVVRMIDKDIFKYEEILLKNIGSDLSQYSARDLVKYIETYNQTAGGANIDFISFSRKHIATLYSCGRVSYAKRFETAINALIDFFDNERITVRDVTSKKLQQFEDYLSRPREIARINQHGRMIKVKKPACGEQGIADYMNLIRILFNAARDEYNDPDTGSIFISHYPFARYKIKVTTEPEKRNINVNDLKKIINLDPIGRRAILAKDVFLLSLCLIGMNTIDLYYAEKGCIKEGRITYKRHKTSDRRKDGALMSIRLEPEVLPLIKKYKDSKKCFSFHRMYVDSHNFNSAVNQGLKQVAQQAGLKIPLSTYYARHTWASIADNDCGISESDIGVALNHVDDKAKVTRKYIRKDWSKIDTMNRKVLDFINK